MAKLTYSMIASVDGYVADAEGKFGWAAPDEEVHRFVNELERPVGTYLYGRRMYEVMSAWETLGSAGEPPHIREFAELWRAAEKIVYSRTLERVSTERTRLEREFDRDAVAGLKESAQRALSIGGPELAGHALEAGLVDELQLFVAPAIVGSGKHFLADGLRLELELVEERVFGNRMAFLRYRVT